MEKNKKRIVVNAGLCLKAHASDLMREYCDKLIERKIDILDVKLGELSFETESVFVQVVTYLDNPDGGDWDEVFGFSREIAIHLRKGHRLNGFSGGVIDYIVHEEETRKIHTPL